jgi:hypothetical protein
MEGGKSLLLRFGCDSTDIGSNTDCGVEPDNFHASETCGSVNGAAPVNPLPFLQTSPRSPRLYLLIF